MEQILLSPRFNLCIGALYFANALFVGFVIDNHQAAKADGSMLTFVEYPHLPDELFHAVESCFSFLFCLELLLRVFTWRLAVLKDPWFVFDICALAPTLLLLLSLGYEVGAAQSVLIVRFLRLVKLCRLLR